MSVIDPPTAYDRPVPYSEAAELAVVGSLLLDRDAIVKIRAYLAASHFYVSAYGAVYGAIAAMADRGVPADLVTVGWELERQDLLTPIGGLSFLFQAIGATPTHVHVEYYAHIVEEAARLRGAITGGGQIAALGYQTDAPVTDIMDQIRGLADAITTAPDAHGLRPARELATALYDEIVLLRDAPGTVTGIPTGLRWLDQLTGGLQPEDVYVIAARPKVGKTSLALQMSRYGAEHGAHVGYFSLEMSAKQIIQHHLAQCTGLDVQQLTTGARMGNAAWTTVQAALGAFGDLPYFLDDRPARSIAEAAARIRQRHATDRLDVVYLDYLQLFGGPKKRGGYGNRQEEVGAVSEAIKHLARELGLPIVALSQLNRTADTGPWDEMPSLSWLRESGAIEQDASVVAFLQRNQRDEGQGHAALLTVVANRHGDAPVATQLHFDGPTTTFWPDVATFQRWAQQMGVA